MGARTRCAETIEYVKLVDFVDDLIFKYNTAGASMTDLTKLRELVWNLSIDISDIEETPEVSSTRPPEALL
jgi:hypothetical protein